MESTVEAKWKRDENHLNRPGWATTRTPKGWSDSEHRNSRGEASLKGIEERLGDGSVLTSQVHIPIRLTPSQKKVLEKASPQDLKILDSFTRHEMRVDAVLDNNALGIPIYIEVDGSQHEQDSVYRGASQSHLDRIKDFCSRLNRGALMIRVRSDEKASEKVERIYKELKRYDVNLRHLEAGDRRSRLQACADALCFDHASGNTPEGIEDFERYINQVEAKIAMKMHRHERFGAEQVKLLNTWARRRNDLKGFVRVFKSLEGEKAAYVYRTHHGRFYHPYAFIEAVFVARDLLEETTPFD